MLLITSAGPSASSQRALVDHNQGSLCLSQRLEIKMILSEYLVDDGKRVVYYLTIYLLIMGEREKAEAEGMPRMVVTIGLGVY